MLAVCQLANKHHVGHGDYNLALWIAGVQFITYILSLVFALKTHKQLYQASDDDKGEDLGWAVGVCAPPIIVLLMSTVGAAILSEYLVHAVEEAAVTLGLNHISIGVILVAIVGNAAEHSTAILMANNGSGYQYCPGLRGANCSICCSSDCFYWSCYRQADGPLLLRSRNTFNRGFCNHSFVCGY